MDNKDKLILDEAKERWRIAEDMLADSRLLMAEDIKFSIGNSDNGYQWHAGDLMARNNDHRPSLTMNKLPQFINQVVNDARANSPQIKLRPVDSGADKESAEIYQGLVRNIENVSGAETAYDTAVEQAARCGMGYFRLITDYADYMSFNQDLIIKRVADPLSIRLDPFFTEFDGSDVKWAFVESNMSKKEFELAYPDAEQSEWEGASVDWYSEDKVRVCEYMRVVEKDKNLQLLSDGSTIYEGDQIPEGLQVTKTRKGKKCEVEWYKITSAHILERTIIKCSYIPIFPVIGNETYVDGKPIRSGMVRNSKDSQRQYNYWASAETEMVALAPKAPFIGYAGQFQDPKWQDANVKNFAYLEVEPVDINGNQAPLPQRQGFAGVPTGIVQAKAGSNQDIRETIGMYNASIGANSSETSGRAILAKQKEGDTGTYHYIDNLARAKGHLGRCLIEMIPHYYDALRVGRTLGDDGSTSEIVINPDSPQALAKAKDRDGKIKRVFNPNIGKYDVTVTVGPSYASQRMEAAEAQLELARVIPTIAQVAPDLIARSFDFKGADEIADRLKATLPAGIAQDEDEEQLPPQAQQAIQQAQQAIQTVEMQKQQLMQAQQEMQEKEAQINDTQSKVENAIAKLQAKEAVFNANQQLAEMKQANDEVALKIMIENARSQNDMAMKDQQIAQMEAYTKQLEDMVQQLSDVVEESADEPPPEMEKEEKDDSESEQPQLNASIEMLADIAEKITKPKRKKSRATKNADGSYTIETEEE